MIANTSHARKIQVTWTSFIFKISLLYSLNVCCPQTIGKDSDQCSSVPSQNEMLPSCADREKKTSCLSLHQAHPWPWTCPTASRSLDLLRSVESVKWMICLCLFSSLFWVQKEKLSWSVYPWEWLLHSILVWLPWYPEFTEASRYATVCCAVPSYFTLDKVIAYFLTDTWNPIYQLRPHNSSSDRARHYWQGCVCPAFFK